MARLQILQLPEGSSDERALFALVVDQCEPQRLVLGMGGAQWRDQWNDIAERIGARAVIVMPDTVEIPANEVTLPEPLELVADAELRHDLDEMRRSYEGACKTIADMHAAATGRSGRGPNRGVVEDVADVRARMLAAEESLTNEQRARAEAEAKLKAFAEAQQREFVDHMDAVTDALGLDRLRDWNEIIQAVRTFRSAADEGGHRFGGPGANDPVVCSVCRLDKMAWLKGDVRTCEVVLIDNAAGHKFHLTGLGGELRCYLCGITRIAWAASREARPCEAVQSSKGEG